MSSKGFNPYITVADDVSYLVLLNLLVLPFDWQLQPGAPTRSFLNTDNKTIFNCHFNCMSAFKIALKVKNKWHKNEIGSYMYINTTNTGSVPFASFVSTYLSRSRKILLHNPLSRPSLSLKDLRKNESLYFLAPAQRNRLQPIFSIFIFAMRRHFKL